MPFSFVDAIFNTISSVKSNNIVSTLIGNPIYVAITIVLLIILIFALVFDEDRFSVSLAKTGCYSLISTIALLFLHDSIIHSKYEQQDSNTMKTSSILSQTPDMQANVNNRIVPRLTSNITGARQVPVAYNTPTTCDQLPQSAAFMPTVPAPVTPQNIQSIQQSTPYIPYTPPMPATQHM